MSKEHPGFRLFFLGAGFSKPAGLPLASDVYVEVKKIIESKHGMDTKFQQDIADYIVYENTCNNVEINENDIDIEMFMSFLDIEHYLGLRGSDTWSEEGNESQIMIRKAIGEVMQFKTPQADKLPKAYYDFAEALSLNDIVITFNYDILLERALEHIGKPYRLFPSRYKEINENFNITDMTKEEVVVLKLHGSVDWFSNKQFLSIKKSFEAQGSTSFSLHSVFDVPSRYGATPIVDGLRSLDDPLLNIHRIQYIDEYYQRDRDFNAPYLLSPSYVKFVYAPPLLDFWRGLGQAGGYNLGIAIIGFSLPEHDDYIRRILYNIITNYQMSWWDEKLLDTLKDNVKFIDFKTNELAKKEYIKRYCFSDPSKSEFWFGGFSTEAVKFLFNQSRKT